jgi:hypothetical protein
MSAVEFGDFGLTIAILADCGAWPRLWGSQVTACAPRSPKRKISLHPNRSGDPNPHCRNCPILHQFCNRWMA